jgi:hypothetical protein
MSQYVSACWRTAKCHGFCCLTMSKPSFVSTAMAFDSKLTPVFMLLPPISTFRSTQFFVVTKMNSVNELWIKWNENLICMREDTYVNIMPTPKRLVPGMEHERSDWTSWLELSRSGECSRSWSVALLPEDCWECCSSLGPARWGVLFSVARWSRREDLAESH